MSYDNVSGKFNMRVLENINKELTVEFSAQDVQNLQAIVAASIESDPSVRDVSDEDTLALSKRFNDIHISAGQTAQLKFSHTEFLDLTSIAGAIRSLGIRSLPNDYTHLTEQTVEDVSQNLVDIRNKYIPSLVSHTYGTKI